MEADHTRVRFSAILAPMAISIQFLGAVGTVTGSQFLVTAGERHVLVDCGMFQGAPEEVSRNRMAFAFDPTAVDALVLTQPTSTIAASRPSSRQASEDRSATGTLDLAEIVLQDATKLQESREPLAPQASRRGGRARRRARRRASVENDAEIPAKLRALPPRDDHDTRRPLLHR